MSDLNIKIPDDWSDDLVMQAITQAVNAAVDMNFYWYLGQWDLNLDPKCCPHCAGLKYRPALPSEQWYVCVAPVILAKGSTSCESAAAMHTGHKRADGFRNLVSTRPLIDAVWTPEGKKAREQVKAAYTIKLEDIGEARYWHVVSLDEGERHDATEELDR